MSGLAGRRTQQQRRSHAGSRRRTASPLSATSVSSCERSSSGRGTHAAGHVLPAGNPAGRQEPEGTTGQLGRRPAGILWGTRVGHPQGRQRQQPARLSTGSAGGADSADLRYVSRAVSPGTQHDTTHQLAAGPASRHPQRHSPLDLRTWWRGFGEGRDPPTRLATWGKPVPAHRTARGYPCKWAVGSQI